MRKSTGCAFFKRSQKITPLAQIGLSTTSATASSATRSRRTSADYRRIQRSHLSSPPADGFSEVLLPGEIGDREERTRIRIGIPYTAAQLDELEKIVVADATTSAHKWPRRRKRSCQAQDGGWPEDPRRPERNRQRRNRPAFGIAPAP